MPDQNWCTHCAGPKLFVPVSLVSAGTKNFEGALKAFQFLVWHKNFGLALNILGPVKGQGINRDCTVSD